MSRVLDALRRDLRSTTRMLAARPGWTVAAVLCLAIATGANTAAFTLVNGLLLRPLPFDEPDRLVMVALRDPGQASTRPFALREYRAVVDQSSATGLLLARTFFPLSLVAADGARMAQAELVSGMYFETLRVKPFLGRFFDRDADRAGVAPLAVLSHRLWQLRFNAHANVIGQSVRVNGRTVVIAGVAPPGFVGAMRLVAADLWLPASMFPDLAGSAEASTVPMFGVMGRLASGVTVDEAAARLTSIVAAVSDFQPSGVGRDAPRDPGGGASASGGPTPPVVVVTRATGFGVPVAVEGVVLALSGFIYTMMALLMIVACANVAALVLARGVGRGREMAVRLSLGASRLHIARQLLTESVVLALAGCAAGTVVAIWLTQALVARLTSPFQYVSYAIDVRPDARVLIYSALATAVAAVLCGIAPIRLAGRVDVVDVLKQSASKGRSRASMRTLDAMVVLQFTVSTMLLVAAGMLVRTYLTAQSTRPAFATTGLITSTLDVDQARLDRAAGIGLYETVMERLSALPGVTGVSLTRDVPFRPGRTVTVRGDTDSRDAPVSAAAMVVSPRYFQTLGLTIREGRTFEDGAPARPHVAVIDEAMARRLWPNASAVGRTFRLSNIAPGGVASSGSGIGPNGLRASGIGPNDINADSIEVIGVVSNLTKAPMTEASIPEGSSSEGSLAPHTPPTFYQPFPHEYAARMTAVLRVSGDPARAFVDIRRTIHSINHDLSIVDLRTMDDWLADIAGQRRIPATVLTLVGLLGLLLSAVGLCGVVAYGVRERTRELGIRLALGARPADVRRLVLRQGLTIVTLGLVLGVVATLALTQVVRSTLFGVGATDPTTLATVCAVLMSAALAALYLPARSASTVEPAHTLRSD